MHPHHHLHAHSEVLRARAALPEPSPQRPLGSLPQASRARHRNLQELTYAHPQLSFSSQMKVPSTRSILLRSLLKVATLTLYAAVLPHTPAAPAFPVPAAPVVTRILSFPPFQLVIVSYSLTPSFTSLFSSVKVLWPCALSRLRTCSPPTCLSCY